MSKSKKLLYFVFSTIIIFIVFINTNNYVQADNSNFIVSDLKLKKCGYGETFTQALQEYINNGGSSQKIELVSLIQDADMTQAEFECLNYFTKIKSADDKIKTLKINGTTPIDLSTIYLKFTNINLISNVPISLTGVTLTNCSFDIPNESNMVISISDDSIIHIHNSLTLNSNITIKKNHSLTLDIDKDCLFTANNIILETGSSIILSGTCIAENQTPLCTNVNSTEIQCTDCELQQDETGLIKIVNAILPPAPDPVTPPAPDPVTPPAPDPVAPPAPDPVTPPVPDPVAPPVPDPVAPPVPDPVAPPVEDIDNPLTENSDTLTQESETSQQNSDLLSIDNTKPIIINNENNIPLANTEINKSKSANPKTKDTPINTTIYLLFISLVITISSYKFKKSRQP